ncbi:hypothetical protein FKW77_008447 [Venturia effusa]|uniref:Uncharacterized protein n=1 Tax=Venturia effusa TaxID=50376 RepID=A0A517LKP3_9PEZI|nr:hypothetical protein FKW77_008447 [Venturia effusa]
MEQSLSTSSKVKTIPWDHPLALAKRECQKYEQPSSTRYKLEPNTSIRGPSPAIALLPYLLKETACADELRE